MPSAATTPIEFGVRVRTRSSYDPDPELRQLPISPPSALVIASTEPRGGRSLRKSGQRVEGLSKVEPSPGCWMARNSVLPSGVNSGPQISEPAGPVKKQRVAPRLGPLVAAAYRLSLKPPASSCPSVEIQMRPFGSKATLSGAHSQPLAVTGAP